ncbi:unnamed protein product [Prorocentrum cordatum]|uniref:Uncharacterized protein n=1 Tax=Prorocentrum cordatum TaxID=2364126 RepID=A0ABN9WMP1_9DINO|nr:unnamed protein product [Polarella glacialis]
MVQPEDAKAKTGPIDVSSIPVVAKNDDGLLAQPEEPKFKTALVEIYVPSQEGGGSDKISNGHRYDSIPIANGFINAGMSCQLVNYCIEKHDEFFAVLEKFDAIVVRCNPGQVNAAGGSQKKFDDAMMKLAETRPVWPTPDVMAKMGAKKALCMIKDMDIGLKDTLGGGRIFLAVDAVWHFVGGKARRCPISHTTAAATRLALAEKHEIMPPSFRRVRKSWEAPERAPKMHVTCDRIRSERCRM